MRRARIPSDQKARNIIRQTRLMRMTLMIGLPVLFVAALLYVFLA